MMSSVSLRNSIKSKRHDLNTAIRTDFHSHSFMYVFLKKPCVEECLNGFRRKMKRLGPTVAQPVII